jgi:hypothetical protein
MSEFGAVGNDVGSMASGGRNLKANGFALGTTDFIYESFS